RRHTRFSRDWSSDVCSSDLVLEGLFGAVGGFGDVALADVGVAVLAGAAAADGVVHVDDADVGEAAEGVEFGEGGVGGGAGGEVEIGRASGREGGRGGVGAGA